LTACRHLAGRLALGVVAALLGGAWSAACAQSASQITPKTFAPPQQGPLSPSLHIAAPGAEAPSGADQLFVTAADLQVVGGFPALASEAAKLRTRFAGHRMSGADIYAAARELETAYARAGYVLVRVTVPAQDIVDGGVIRLQVIDGYIERIETGRLPWRMRGRVAALLRPLQGHGRVREQDLERQLLLAGDAPGVTLRSTLAPGSAVGAAVLVVEATYQPVVTVLTGDNSLGASLGRFQVGGGFTFNSLLGLGEQVYLRASGDPSGGADDFLDAHARNRILAAGVLAPIGDNGLTINLEGTLTRTTPSAPSGLQSTDQFERVSVRVRYPWLRSRSLNVSSQLVFEAEDEEDWLFNAEAKLPISLDRLRVIREETDVDYLTPWGADISGSLTPSVGIDAFGARDKGDASPILPLSVQGADANFAKLAVTAAYNQTLVPHLALALSGSAQTSFGQALAHSEEFGISGPGQLSTFDAGTLQGDSGYLGRAELSTPFALPRLHSTSNINSVAAPYLFVAYGAVFLADPTALQQAHVEAGSVGVGLRLYGGVAASPSNAQLAIEFGRQARSDGVRDEDRLSLSGALNF
jgi:hemolysin activation/secretion protein